MNSDEHLLAALYDKSADKESVLRTLAEYSRLPSNWDGDGSDAFYPETVQKSIAALLKIVKYTVCPTVSPTGEGFVLFEWESELGTATLQIAKTLFSFALMVKGFPSHLEGGSSEELPPHIPMLIDDFLFPRPLRSSVKTVPPKTIDHVVEAVRADLLERSRIGIAKYGTTLDRTDLSLRDWLQHAYEETLDQANYLKRAIIGMDNAGVPRNDK